MSSLDPDTLLPRERGRAHDRRADISRLRNEGGVGAADLSQHNVEVLDFASVRREEGARANGKAGSELKGGQRQEEESGKGKGSMDSGADLSASAHELRLRIAGEEKKEDEGEGRRDVAYGEGPHAHVWRKPMVGERGHGPVVQGGRGAGQRRGGGPGVSVMQD